MKQPEESPAPVYLSTGRRALDLETPAKKKKRDTDGPRPEPLFDRTILVGAAVIVGLVIIAYMPAANNGFVWDDKMYVQDNGLLSAPDGLTRIWLGLHLESTDPVIIKCETPQYYPLVFTTFYLEHMLWGLDPTGYHWTNVALQAINAILIMLLLRRLGFMPVLAWAIAALFAVHPVGTETVAWISERKNLLSSMFYLAAFLAYLRFSDRGQRVFYALSFVLFLCALMSKSVTATLPVVIVLSEWLRRRPVNARLLLRVAPFLVVGLLSGLLTANIEHFHVGAHGAQWDFSLIERCLIATRALCFYAEKLLAPLKLTFIYGRWEIDSGAPSQYVFPVIVAAVFTAAFVLRKWIGRKPLFGLVFFAVTLLPALGFVDFYPQIFSFVADHFQYLGSLGFMTAVVAIAAWGLNRMPNEAPRRILGAVLVVVALAGSIILTREQCRIYESEETLWSDTINKNQGDFIGHTNLGFFYLQEQRLQEAELQFGSAVANNPDFLPALQNLAGAYLTNGKPREAEPVIRRAIELDPDNAQHHNLLGGVLMRLHRYEEAEKSFLEAIRLDETLHLPSGNIAAMAYKQGRWDVAEEHYRRVVILKPRLATPRVRLAQVLMKQKKSAEAAKFLREALRVKPEYSTALNMLARILATSGDASVRNGVEAVDLAKRACRTSGFTNRRYLLTLGAAYAEAGDFESAIHYQKKLVETASAEEKTELVRILRLYESRSPLRE